MSFEPRGGAISVPAEFYDKEHGANQCPVCLEPRFTLLHRVEHYGFPFEFHRCRCGLIKQVPLPNERFFEWFFNSDLFFSSKQARYDEIWGFYDYFHDESSRLKTSRRRYRKLSRLLGWDDPISIMKIGPSTGTFLYVAAQAGHDVLGCDVSDRFVRYALETYGVQVDHGRFERIGYEDGRFDAILLFNVIENVPDIEELLAAVQRTLRPGGHFILNHVEMKGNLIAKLQKEKYFLFRPPICYAFESPALQRLLARFGLEKRHDLLDIRYLHLEKISTLLRWRWLHGLARKSGTLRAEFPIWAYPSRISVFERVG